MLDLAGIAPITPGGFGIATGAVAMALASRGISGSQALGVGIAMQAVETVVSLAVGGLGTLYLLWPRVSVRPLVSVRRWAVPLTAALTSVGLAAMLGAAVLDLL